VFIDLEVDDAVERSAWWAWRSQIIVRRAGHQAERPIITGQGKAAGSPATTQTAADIMPLTDGWGGTGDAT
jgi:hypothetical protein